MSTGNPSTGGILTEVDSWAAGIAATLPPLTATEAAAVGRLAAELDARRAGLLAASQPTRTSPPTPARRAA